MAMLEVKDLEVYYGVIQAIKGISFEVNEGEVIALIGANGAGKTTILHTVTGLLHPKMCIRDRIYAEDESPVDRLKAAYEPKGIRVFPISGVSGKGIKELLYYVNDQLKNLEEGPVVLSLIHISLCSPNGSVRWIWWMC